MPASRKFSEAQLRAAALVLVDERGLAALTMRNLAGVLGTGAMTIYNYVDGRDGLEALLVDAVMAPVAERAERLGRERERARPGGEGVADAPGATGDARAPRATGDDADAGDAADAGDGADGGGGVDWRADVRVIAEAHWLAVRAHPDVIPLILTRRSVDRPTLASGEALLAALARGGRTGRELLFAFRTVSAFMMGFAQAELARPLSTDPDADAAALIGRIRALPDERYPRLREIADVATDSSPQEEFHAGLDLVLAALTAPPAPTPRPAAGSLPAAGSPAG